MDASSLQLIVVEPERIRVEPMETPRWKLPSGTLVLHYLILTLVAVVIGREMWRPALLSGHAGWLDFVRMVEFHAAIKSGDLLPSWSPDFYRGYGSPFFQFYSPLSYYFAEIPVLLGAEIPTAMKLTQWLALLGSGIAMYIFVSTRLSRWAACLGAVLYMAAPYRLVDLFVRHAFAEHCAFVWLPLIALGTERFTSERTRAGLTTGAFATAGLVLTHNVMALIGLPFAVAVGWAVSERPLFLKSLLRAVWPATLGVGLAAFFWWPALDGRAFTWAEKVLISGPYDFRTNFVEAGRFVAAGWGFGGSHLGADDRMSLQIGWPHLIAGVGCVLLLFVTWRKAGLPSANLRWALVGGLAMILSLWMCHESSLRVWETLTLLSYAQFPWRFLGLMVFGAAMCGAALADRLGAAAPQWRLPIFFAALIGVMTTYFPYYRDVRFHVFQERTGAPLQVPVPFVDRLEAAGRLIPVADLVTTERMRATLERGAVVDDFLPIGVRQMPSPIAAQPAPSSIGTVQSTVRPGKNYYRAEVAMNADGALELHQFWFPGWKASVDGKKVPVAAAGDSAVVSCAVPAGEHAVEFWYAGPPRRWQGFALSLLAGLILFSVTSTRVPWNRRRAQRAADYQAAPDVGGNWDHATP